MMQQNIDDIKCNDMPGEAPAGTQRAYGMPGVSGVWTYETASNADRAGMPGVPRVQEGRAYGAASDVAPAGTRVQWGYDDAGSHGDDVVIVGTPASSTWGGEPSPTDPGLTQPGTHQTHQAHMGAIDPDATMPGATMPDAHLYQAHMGAIDPGVTMPDTNQAGAHNAGNGPKAPARGALEGAGALPTAATPGMTGVRGSSPAWSPRPVRLASMRAEFASPVAQPVSPTADLVSPATHAVSSIAEFRSPMADPFSSRTHAVSSTVDPVSPMAQPVSSIAEFFAPGTEPLAATNDYSTQEMVLEQTNVPLASSARVAGRELTALTRIDDARFQASYDEDGGQFRPEPPRPGAYGRLARATAPLTGPTRRRTSGQLTRRATGSLAASERTRRTSGQLPRRATSSLATGRTNSSSPLPARSTRSLAASEHIGPSGHLVAAEWDEGQPVRGERDTILLILVALFILGVAGVLGFGYLLSLSSVHLTSFLAG